MKASHIVVILKTVENQQQQETMPSALNERTAAAALSQISDHDGNNWIIRVANRDSGEATVVSPPPTFVCCTQSYVVASVFQIDSPILQPFNCQKTRYKYERRSSIESQRQIQATQISEISLPRISYQ